MSCFDSFAGESFLLILAQMPTAKTALPALAERSPFAHLFSHHLPPNGSLRSFQPTVILFLEAKAEKRDTVVPSSSACQWEVMGHVFSMPLGNDP